MTDCPHIDGDNACTICEELAKLKMTDLWTQNLVGLVGQCVTDQHDGMDILASASWDAVVDHWKTKPGGKR
jgi:hypothetical protein